MNLVCVSLVYEKLSRRDSEELSKILGVIQCSYETLQRTYQENKQKYYCIKNPTIINKCNGTLLIANCDNTNPELVISMMKNLWIDCIDKEKVSVFQSKFNKLESYYGIDALIYLCETSVGMHSLVYGDIQVYSQVIDGLKKDEYYNFMESFLNDVMMKIKKETKINCGNVSIERVLTDIVHNKGIKEISLFGFGKSGKLISKSLAEKGIKVNVYTRQKVNMNDKNIVFKEYHDIRTNDVFDCIVALENNNETLEIIKKYIKQFKFIYDISSPSLFENLNVKNIMLLEEIVKVGKENENMRKKGNNQARNIIFEMSNAFYISLINKYELPINYELNNISLIKTILKTRNEINNSIRNFMNDNNFLEINTPSILTLATEGENSALSIEIDGREYYLKQSSQLLQQILVNVCSPKVFDIAQVFRNENIGINSMYEFQLFSCEWQNNDFSEVLKTFENLVNCIFKNFCYKFTTITYDEAFGILNDQLSKKVEYGVLFNEQHIKAITNYIYNKYGTKILIIKQYPINYRKFYHSLDQNNKVNTFRAYFEDVCFASGGERQTDKEEIKNFLYISNLYIEKYKAYLDILNPEINHGGFSISIEALISIMLKLSTCNSCKIFKNIQL